MPQGNFENTSSEIISESIFMDPLFPDTSVWIRTEWSQTTGHIQSPAYTPRSYIVTTTYGQDMAKSLELDNTLHPDHQYRHVSALEFQ